MVGDARGRNAHESFSHERHVGTQANRLVAKLILRGGAIDDSLLVPWHSQVAQRLARHHVCRLIGESNLIGAWREGYAGADEDCRSNQEESVRSPLHGEFSNTESMEINPDMLADRNPDCKKSRRYARWSFARGWREGLVRLVSADLEVDRGLAHF